MQNIRHNRWKVIILLLFSLPGLLAFVAPKVERTIYWGARISGSTYGTGDVPWDIETLQRFEQHTQKQPSIISWGQPWWLCSPTCRYQSFQDQLTQYNLVRNQGHIPFIDWASWDYSIKPQYNQPNFSLHTIIMGQHDEYIRQWASEARDWDHPFFLRFDWEMNGDWFPWSEQRNGNQPGEYVQAWRHVHDIFTSVNATNVTWVWCPNVNYSNSPSIDQFYPGETYVDWLCMDGYNWGTNPIRPDSWQSFDDIFGSTYDDLGQLNTDKPVMIGEMSSTEVGGSKASWIRDALAYQLPQRFTRIEALLWFNWDLGGMDWAIESSDTSQAAFASAIASSYFAGSEFANLSAHPIPPYSRLQPYQTLLPIMRKVAMGASAGSIISYSGILFIQLYRRKHHK